MVTNMSYLSKPFDQAYTVLDSTTRSVFLGITTNDVKDYKFGNLFRSDSNGNYFSLSRKFLNQGNEGTVDFEKMQGVDGVALMNEVMNPNDVLQRSPKQIRSLATFDNGIVFFFIFFFCASFVMSETCHVVDGPSNLTYFFQPDTSRLHLGDTECPTN